VVLGRSNSQDFWCFEMLIAEICVENCYDIVHENKIELFLLVKQGCWSRGPPHP
jgi:hypothetical protein